MKKEYRIIGGVLALSVGAGLIHTNLRLARLEARMESIHQALEHPSSQPVGYAYYRSFTDYFGEKGVEELSRAVHHQNSTRITEASQRAE